MNGYGNPTPYAGWGSFLPGGVGSGYANLGDPGKQYFEENPDTGYMDWLVGQGLGGNDQRSRYAQNQYGRYYAQFKANLARDPIARAQSGDQNQFWSGFLNNNNVNPMKEFYAQGPQERGDANLGSGRLRWLMSVI